MSNGDSLLCLLDVLGRLIVFHDFPIGIFIHDTTREGILPSGYD